MSLASFLRYVQGERPGMSAWREGSLNQTELTWFLPALTISTDLRFADVSYYQLEIDFEVMHAAGIAGVFIRAGQRNWTDVRFRENWGKAKRAGLPRGSYWLYDSREDPIKQAALWFSLIKDDPGEMYHVADLEEGYGGPYGKPEHFKKFLNEFQRLLLTIGRADKVAIYTGYFWWLARVGNDPFFRKFFLWLAWYAPMSVVRVPLPWGDGDLFAWQYTSSGNGLAYGVGSKEIDLDWYCCSADDFQKRFGVTVDVPTPSTTGGPMWFRVNTTPPSILNLREGPGTSYQDLGDAKSGDLLETTDQDFGGWRKVTAWMRGGVILDLPNPTSTYVKSSYLAQVDAPVPPPDPTPVPDPAPVVLVHILNIRIFNDGSYQVDVNDGPFTP